MTETSARPPREAGEIVTDEDGSGAKALADFLAVQEVHLSEQRASCEA